jgi:hypothetical protein
MGKWSAPDPPVKVFSIFGENFCCPKLNFRNKVSNPGYLSACARTQHEACEWRVRGEWAARDRWVRCSVGENEFQRQLCERCIAWRLFVDRVTEGQSNIGSSQERINFNRCNDFVRTRGTCTQAGSHGFDRAGRGGRHGLLVCV